MTWQAAQVAWLEDGRLHLHHGPIDLIIDCKGPGRSSALTEAISRFATILEELVPELSALRSDGRSDGRSDRCSDGRDPVSGPVARRMVAAIGAVEGCFVTPMAAVAGAVADEILGCLTRHALTSAHVNNGGDIALFLAPGETLTAAIVAPVPGCVTLHAGDGIGGIATSGWRGRSHSLGIADAVTVLASNAASADAAATLIANRVDLPEHPAILRAPASDLSPDSDLGGRLVTVDVGDLTARETHRALLSGHSYARKLVADGMIAAASLVLRDVQMSVGLPLSAPQPALDGQPVIAFDKTVGNSA